MWSEKTLTHYIDGAFTAAQTSRTADVRNPATGEVVARVPLADKSDVDKAVKAASAAFDGWRRTPAPERARALFRFKNLLEKNFEDIARTVTREHGKTLDEARGSVKRGLENVEHACGMPTLLMGDSLEDISAGIDCETFRQPLGVFAAITPFNFPAMVPLWFWPYAVAAGNTFVVKPSEGVPTSQQLLFELIHEAGFPPGVLNLVHGDAEAAQALVAHPDVAGISFVGSTSVAQKVYEDGARRGKRVQALGGAKNHMVVMPDADLDITVPILTESAYGCTGQRCLAGNVVVAVGGVYDELKARLMVTAQNVRVGNGVTPGVEMGPVINARQLDRIASMIHKGIEQGAEVLVDGRKISMPEFPGGHWMGPTLLAVSSDDNVLAQEEVFGPVIVLRRAATLDDAISMVRASRYANATSIFTRSGKAARDYKYKVGVSMIGVNIGVAAPMAFFPFGGTKSSFFGDTKAHGKDSVNFFTDQKVVISRWF